MATYNISTLDELQAMNSHLADDCVLLNDINAVETRTWNEKAGFPDTYEGFEPVGSLTGSFNGQGFTISNLYINRPTSGAAGLFTTIKGSGKEVKDLTLKNVDITAQNAVGGLAGYVQYTTITNVHVSGNIEATGDENGTLVGKPVGGAGGLTGSVHDAAVSDCSSTAVIVHKTDLTAIMCVGGFIGSAYGTATLTDCTAAGSVTATLSISSAFSLMAGGFAGRAGEADYSSCYASGNVTVNVITTTGTVRAGGFFGSATTSASTATKCFAYGDVSSLSISPAYVGGFVGWATACDFNQCGAEGDTESSSTNATQNYIGGFVGKEGSSSKECKNCYARGKVCEDGIGHADAYIGGFAGYINATTAENCYSAGAVYATGTPTNGGGFSGGSATATYTNCFYDTETSGWSSSDGGTAKTTEQMHTESTFTDAGWDLDAIWYLASFTRAPGAGNTVWFSHSEDYDNFDEGVGDADSFALTIPTGNQIRWLEALEALFVGASGDVWIIKSNNLDTPITPTNFSIKQISNYGSAAIQPVKVNEAILFIDFVKRKVRELVYSDELDKHVSPDLTALAEHITESGITSIAIQSNPDSILWCTLDDGSLISLTYDREQNVVAWSKHPIGGTDVVVQSVCVIPGTSEDQVSLSVRRTINGSSVTYIEKMASRIMPDNLEDCFFVDSGLTYDGTPTSTITGLDHLEGETVKVLGDGVVMDDAEVSSGQISVTLDGVVTNVSKAPIGLGYTYKLEPLKPVVNAQVGSSAASITHVAEMGVSLLNSAGVKYGVSDDDLYDVNLTDAQWTNLSDITNLFTGTVVVAIDGGFSLERPLIISGNDPLPCTVRALIPRLEVTGR